MNILPNAQNAVIPIEKFTKYALNPDRDINKATAFELALGYNLDNYKILYNEVLDNLTNFQAIERGYNKFGRTYEVILQLTGVNGKMANVLTSWIIENGCSYPRLTNIYVTSKKRGGRIETK